MKWGQLCTTIITTSIFHIICNSIVHAADYTTIVKSNYLVSPQSDVTVNRSITIVNNTDSKYPTSLEFTERTFDINNLKMSGPSGQPITPLLKKLNQGTQVEITFPSPIIGKSKSQTYDLSFQNNDLRIGSGKTIELHIPPTDINDPNASISATISIPSALCSNPFVLPTISSIEDIQDNKIIHLDKLSNDDGIFLRCVDQRFITAILQYALENSNMTPIETQITLPPDTNFQYFEFTRIDPLPILLTTDNDGNRIATYKLEPKQNLIINVEAQAILSSAPNQVTWSTSNSHRYLDAQSHWAVGDSGFKKILTSIKPDQINTYLIRSTQLDNADNNSENRHGSKQLLTKPDSLTAQDIVDAAITLKRSSGIMSRRMVGVVTNSSSGMRPNEILNHTLHTWLDYYDSHQNAWIPEDITWAQSSSNSNYVPIHDLNHIVLAINGISDTTPYPAGFYSSSTLPAPQVSISDNPGVSFSSLKLIATIETSWLSKPKLMIDNKGYKAEYQLSGTLNTDQVAVPFTIDRLPIGGQSIIPITLPKSYNQLTITIGDQHVPLTRHIMGFSRQFAITCAVVATAGFFAVISGRLLVSRRKR
jgi:hypothetical protein